MRLDQYITETFSLTRNRAQQLIALGLVRVNGRTASRSSLTVAVGMHIELIEDKRIHWVSRSAQKLHDFLVTHDAIDVGNSTCLDVGSSTGGFTQVLLEHGASHVDAVDVGTDQLHPSLRLDPRVAVYEQTDIRDFSSEQSYDIVVCDASFISLIDIIDAILSLVQGDTEIILLFKPQFEVGKDFLTKSGIPKDTQQVQIVMKRWEEVLWDH